MSNGFGWSYSIYSTFSQCMRKGRLLYVDKLVVPGLESGDMCFGSALHSAINSVLNGDDGEITFEIYWNSYEGKELTYGRFKWAELRDLGLNFISKFTRLHAKKYQLEQAEVRLYAEYRGVKLEGTADFIGLYNGRRSLRDFKTSGYNYPKEKADVALQLYLYSFLAISNSLKAPETLGYDVFVKGTGSIQTLSWEFDEKRMYEMLDGMVDHINLIQMDAMHDYPKNPNACLYPSKCPFFSTCWVKNQESDL